MAKLGALSFAKACEYLGISADEMAELRKRGLVASSALDGKQIYSSTVLDIARRLLALGHKRSWAYDTLAWYIDLIFATQIGRAMLLPIQIRPAQAEHLHPTWLDSAFATSVLSDLADGVEEPDGSFVALLRSLVFVERGQFWPDEPALRQSALYPIIEQLEATGILILDQQQAIARDAGPIVVSALYAFATIAPPISNELGQLVRAAQGRLHTKPQIPNR